MVPCCAACGACRRRDHAFDHDALEDRDRAPDRDRTPHCPQARGRAGVRHLSADLDLAAPPVERSISGRRWRWRYTIRRRRSRSVSAWTCRMSWAAVLAGRGVSLAAVPFMSPKLRDALPDPSHLSDLDGAVERLPMRSRRTSASVCSATTMSTAPRRSRFWACYLAAVGAPTAIDVPDRLREGYGPNAQASGAPRRPGLPPRGHARIAAPPRVRAARGCRGARSADHRGRPPRRPGGAASRARRDQPQPARPGQPGRRAGCGRGDLPRGGGAEPCAAHAGPLRAPAGAGLRRWLDLVALGNLRRGAARRAQPGPGRPRPAGCRARAQSRARRARARRPHHPRRQAPSTVRSRSGCASMPAAALAARISPPSC